jgi:Mrp family chromosome partitioning ATPase
MSQVEIVKSRIVGVGAISRPEARPTQTITTFAWSSSPVCIVEEVELQRELDPRLVLLRTPGSAQARSYRLLQHRVLASNAPRIVAVTSAEPGEGKTTCAANLALAFAEGSLSRVLLVDANLARPGVADLFGFAPSSSFMTKLLRNEDSAPPHLVASVGGSSLQLAALESSVAHGRRLDRMLLAEVLRSLRTAYDYVVIDTASVLESADVNSVCQCSDAVVIAARAGKTRKARLRRAIEQLQPANVVGTALIDC